MVRAPPRQACKPDMPLHCKGAAHGFLSTGLSVPRTFMSACFQRVRFADADTILLEQACSCVHPRLCPPSLFACAVQAVVALSTQYRMAADIMLLANTIVYGGQLTCGSEAVAARSLALQPGVVGGLPQWLQLVSLHQDVHSQCQC